MQDAVILSLLEGELVAAKHCYQEMFYAQKVLEVVGIKVKLQMLLKVGNKCTIDVINCWSVGSRTGHIDACYLFLRKAKENSMVKISGMLCKNNCFV
jgi:hypothetical protein